MLWKRLFLLPIVPQKGEPRQLVAQGGDLVLHLALVQAGLAGECLLQGGLHLLPAHGAGGLPHRLVDLLLGGQALDSQVRLRLALLLQAGHVAAEGALLLLGGEVAGALLEGQAGKDVPVGAVNGGAYAPFILTVDWLGWLCYFNL